MSAATFAPHAGIRKWPLLVTAFATGFAVMAAELTAVRLLAPHFGDSAYVWTNVIGVILAAMALGAALGGRLSTKDAAASFAFWLLLIAGALLLLAPFAVRWLGAALLPADLPLDAAMPALIRGSLVATAVVFAPPMLLLAAVSPLLITLLANSGRSIGRSAGDVAAAGTIGSLIGTFAATHWLVPGFGCRIALVVSASVLIAAALLVAPPRQRVAAGALLLLGGLMPLAHSGPLRAPPAGATLLAERETPYQFLQVQRSKSGEEATRTSLIINEGLDSFHSLLIEGTAFTNGAYYDWHALAPLLAGDGAVPFGMRALSIGDAAGTLRQVYAAVHPGVAVDAVDIDAETMALGDEFFLAPKADGSRYALDGRQFLALCDQQWHTIHVDAYAHQVYVPAHLASTEFFQAAYERLHDGGILACNVGALSLKDEVLTAVAATVGTVFGEVHTFLVPGWRNALLVARRQQPLQVAKLASVDTSASKLSAADRETWQQMLKTCAEPANWHLATATEPVLCDDLPLLDELLFRSYVDHRDPHQVVACVGKRGSNDVEQEAFEALQAGDWERVLRVAGESSTATALLRQFGGDARWYRRELHSAELEYRAGLQLNPEPALRSVLAARVRAAEEQLKPIVAAEAAASTNGWLSVVVGVLGLAAIALVRRV